jgi:hypothetical protein
VRRGIAAAVTSAMQANQFPSPFPAYQPRGVPPVKRAFRRLVILAGVIVGGLVLFVGGLYAYNRLRGQHTILIDNGNDFVAEVDVGGEHLSLAPHTSRSLRVHDGKLEVKTTGPNGFSETVAVDLPATGFLTGGRRALYNIGGAGALGIITMTYGSVLGAPEFYEPVTEKMMLLPAGVSGDIDDGFPSSVTGRRGQSGAVERRICHVDVTAQTVACPGVEKS